MKSTYKIAELRKERSFLAFVGLVTIFLIFSVASPNFLTLFNFMSILRQASIISILSVGMTFVIISGGIDLSVSAIVSLSGTIAALLMVKFGGGTGLGIAGALSVGLLIGILNGLIITNFDVPPIISTLGMMTISNGMALALTSGYSVTGLPKTFAIIGRRNIGPIPMPVIIMFIMYSFGYMLLKKTRFGEYVFGIGGNEEAARLAGISVKKIKTGVYMFSGLMASVSGLILASRLDSGQPMAGNGLELNTIAAVVIGGASVNGGVGGVMGSLVGALIMSVLNNGFDLIGVGRYYQMIFTGMVLILAVSIQKQRKGKRRTA
jgi:ribose transport system permease protein